MKTTVIDFHTHILPRMDDGSKSADMSMAMLHRMSAAGTDIVVATPHFYGSREDVSSFLSRRADAYRLLSQRLDGNSPRIIPGAEVAFYSGLLSLDPSKLCIDGTNTLLLEMPYAAWTDFEINTVSELCLNRGIHVVLAHWERYAGFQHNRTIVSQLLELPVSIQINAGALLPFFAGRKWLELFARGEAHLLGSDCHDADQRSPNLNRARAVIMKRLGEDVLRDIDRRSAELLGLAETEMS